MPRVEVGGDENPLVSIITMSYNYARFLPETIEAILGQDHVNIQYIVADDGSTDGSVEVVRRYQAADPRIELVELPLNKGACVAYAHAYKRVRGEFVCSIDADDVPMPSKLSRQLAFFRDNPSYDLCTTYIDVIDGEGRTILAPNFQESWVNQPRDLNDLSNWFATNYVSHSAVMMRRSAHDQVGVLDQDMVFAPDHDHFVRFVSAGYKIAVLNEKLLKYRIHGNNNTHKNPAAVYIEITYTFWRCIAPILVAERRFEELSSSLSEIVTNEQFAQMSFNKRMRLLGLLSTSPAAISCYADFLAALEAADPFGGYMLEAALAHSPGAREMRSMLRSTVRMWESLAWYKTQIFDTFDQNLLRIDSSKAMPK